MSPPAPATDGAGLIDGAADVAGEGSDPPLDAVGRPGVVADPNGDDAAGGPAALGGAIGGAAPQPATASATSATRIRREWPGGFKSSAQRVL